MDSKSNPMGCCSHGVAAPRREAELDSLIGALRNQTMRYNSLLNGLLNSIETPRPQNVCKEEVLPPCNSAQGALQEMIDELGRTNERFEVTIKRLDEQVGDLKILP